MIKKQKISDGNIYIHWKQTIAGFFKTLPDADLKVLEQKPMELLKRACIKAVILRKFAVSNSLK